MVKQDEEATGLTSEDYVSSVFMAGTNCLLIKKLYGWIIDSGHDITCVMTCISLTHMNRT